MAIVDRASPEIPITSEALGLLNMCSSELEDVLYRTAEKLALARRAATIDLVDIEAATRHLVQVIEASDLASDVKPALSSMLQCLPK